MSSFCNHVCWLQIAQKVRMANQLQQGQRVAVRREHICGIRYHDTLEDSEDEEFDD
jgi:hypothetical protein